MVARMLTLWVKGSTVGSIVEPGGETDPAGGGAHLDVWPTRTGASASRRAPTARRWTVADTKAAVWRIVTYRHSGRRDGALVTTPPMAKTRRIRADAVAPRSWAAICPSLREDPQAIAHR